MGVLDMFRKPLHYTVTFAHYDLLLYQEDNKSLSIECEPQTPESEFHYVAILSTVKNWDSPDDSVELTEEDRVRIRTRVSGWLARGLIFKARVRWM